mgnify:CR=1 FL=1
MKDYSKIMRAKREAKGLSEHKLSQQLEQFFRICEALDIQLFPEEE